MCTDYKYLAKHMLKWMLYGNIRVVYFNTLEMVWKDTCRIHKSTSIKSEQRVRFKNLYLIAMRQWKLPVEVRKHFLPAHSCQFFEKVSEFVGGIKYAYALRWGVVVPLSNFSALSVYSKRLKSEKDKIKIGKWFMISPTSCYKFG